MGIECGIHLQNPTNSYFPGETIHGRIVIVNDSQRNVKGLKVSFEGKCEVNFTESERRRRPTTHHNHGHTHGHGHGRHERHRHQHGSHSSGHHDDHHHGNEISDYETVQIRCTAEETYLSSELNIFGNDGSDVMIPAGRYEYPFTYILPHGLPSSYGGSHGKVTYSIRAVLPRSWAFDCKTKTTFHVNGLLDLNMHPEAQQDSQLRQHKNLGCCCFSSGTVSFVLKLQKRGVVVGGFVPFVVEINNGSNQTVKGSMSIYQEVKFYAQGKTKTEKNIICTVEGPSMLRGEEELWRGNVLQVPQIPPTGLGGGCHLIDIKYFLKIVLSGTGVFSTLESKTPIIIGTIPFRSTQNVFYEPPPPYNSVSSSYNSPSTGPSAPVFPSPSPAPANTNIGFGAPNTGGYPDSYYPPTENYPPEYSKSAIN